MQLQPLGFLIQNINMFLLPNSCYTHSKVDFSVAQLRSHQTIKILYRIILMFKLILYSYNYGQLLVEDIFEGLQIIVKNFKEPSIRSFKFELKLYNFLCASKMEIGIDKKYNIRKYLIEQISTQHFRSGRGRTTWREDREHVLVVCRCHGRCTAVLLRHL